MESASLGVYSVSESFDLPANKPLVITATKIIEAITTAPITNRSRPLGIGAGVPEGVRDDVGFCVKVPRGVGVLLVAVTEAVEVGRVAVGERLAVGVFPT